MSYLSQRLGLTRYEADEYYAQALDAYNKGELDNAIDNIGFAITLLPMNAEYHAVRGLFNLEDGVEKKARENFQSALKIHAGEVLANYGMGVLAYRGKEYEDAVKYFNRARAVDPMRAEVPYYLAMIHHRQQENETARVYMAQALELMEASGDKRKSDARKWVREFDKLIKQAKKGKPEDDKPLKQAELPISGAASGIRISRDELTAGAQGGALGAGDGEEASES
ncbi:MAG: tetratricopeptide repeat protein [Chloroflexota bacterium]